MARRLPARRLPLRPARAPGAPDPREPRALRDRGDGDRGAPRRRRARRARPGRRARRGRAPRDQLPPRARQPRRQARRALRARRARLARGDGAARARGDAPARGHRRPRRRAHAGGQVPGGDPPRPGVRRRGVGEPGARLAAARARARGRGRGGRRGGLPRDLPVPGAEPAQPGRPHDAPLDARAARRAGRDLAVGPRVVGRVRVPRFLLAALRGGARAGAARAGRGRVGRREPPPASRPGRRLRRRLLRGGGHLAREPGALHDAAPARAGPPRGRPPGHGARAPAAGPPRRDPRPSRRAAGERRGARPDRVAHRHARARHALDGGAPAARRAGRDRGHALVGVRRAADAARHRWAPRRAGAGRARGLKDFKPFVGDGAGAVFEPADAYYIPFHGFGAVERPGPRVRIYALG